MCRGADRERSCPRGRGKGKGQGLGERQREGAGKGEPLCDWVPLQAVTDAREGEGTLLVLNFQDDRYYSYAGLGLRGSRRWWWQGMARALM